MSRSAALGSIVIDALRLSWFLEFLRSSPSSFVSRKNKECGLRHRSSLPLGVVCRFFRSTYRNRFGKIIQRIPLKVSIKGPISIEFDNFLHGISGLLSVKRFSQAMALSFGVWVIEATCLYLTPTLFLMAYNISTLIS